MANPLLISLGNIIPQATAQASRHGKAEAWRAARAYACFALPFFVGYAALVLALPGQILLLFYGAASAYTDLATVLRLLALGALLGYAADIFIAFLHGVVALRLATLINAIGLLATLALSWPLVGQFGLVGGCLMAIAANLARLAACRSAMAKVVGPSHSPAAPSPLAVAQHRE
jgi:O-antigen/teichoic acid export membrane protein